MWYYLDTPAGLEHFGRAVADGFSCAVVMADTSYNALSVARESAGLARQLGIEHTILVVNRVHGDEDSHRLQAKIGENEDFSHIIFLPFDAEVARTEPSVAPLVLAESAFTEAVQTLASSISSPETTSRPVR